MLRIWAPPDRRIVNPHGFDPSGRGAPSVRHFGGMSFASRGAIRAAGGGAAPATGPDSWDPWQYWDAADAIDGADFDWPSNNGAAFVQTVDADEPTVSAASANWNSKDAVGFDGTSEHTALDTADVALADQRFLHDGTSDWEVVLLFRIDAADPGGGRRLLATANSGANVGLTVLRNLGNERIDVQIGNGSSAIGTASTPTGSVVPEVTYLLRITFDASSGDLSVSLDGGTPATASAITGFASGDANGSLTIGSMPNATLEFDGEIAFLFISKTIADAARQKEQLDYFLGLDGIDTTATGWVAQYPVSANGAMYSPEDGTLSGFMADLSPNGNDLTTASNDPSIDSATYGAAVVDFNGTSHYLSLPSGIAAAISNGTDLPYSTFFGARPEALSGGIVSVGTSASNTALQCAAHTGDEARARRSDGTTTNTLDTANNELPLNSWASLGHLFDGSGGYWADGSDPNPVSTGTLSSGALASDSGRVGRDAATAYYDGQMGRLVIDAAYIQGMVRAKLLRWVDYYTQTL